MNPLPWQAGWAEPKSPDEANTVIRSAAASLNSWCVPFRTRGRMHRSASPKLCDSTSPRLCRIT
jgi:hypothetical protein